MAVTTLPSSDDVGGYENKFIDTPHDRYVCKVCLHPCRDPCLSGCCGHNFCKSCVENSKKTTAVCPFCRNDNFTTFPNMQADREIRSFHIFCSNEEKGCKWQGELNNINSHLENSDGCRFESVKCANECGKMLQRRYLSNHTKAKCPRRKVNCQYCCLTGEHQFIEAKHREQCPKLPLSCPNNCEVGSVPREDMEVHRKECPREEVECLNNCKKVFQRQFLITHCTTECPRRKVDCQYCHITGEHQFIEGEHKEQCPKLPLPCPNKCEVGSVPREDMEAHRKECPLEMVQCEYHNVGCEDWMAREDQEKHNSVMMQQHLSLTTSELVETKNQLTDALSRIGKLEAAMANKTEAVHYDAISTALTQWTFQLIVMATAKDNTLPMTIKISEYTKLKQTHWNKSSIYSHDRGYKMRFRVFPGGYSNGKGTHMSISLLLLKGPYDDELTWPMKENFELKLLNQISDCEHHSQTLDFGDDTTNMSSSRVVHGDKAIKGWGNHLFISNEYLHKVTPTRQYLKDDCIFLQVSKLT